MADLEENAEEVLVDEVADESLESIAMEEPLEPTESTTGPERRSTRPKSKKKRLAEPATEEEEQPKKKKSAKKPTAIPAPTLDSVGNKTSEGSGRGRGANKRISGETPVPGNLANQQSGSAGGTSSGRARGTVPKDLLSETTPGSSNTPLSPSSVNNQQSANAGGISSGLGGTSVLNQMMLDTTPGYSNASLLPSSGGHFQQQRGEFLSPYWPPYHPSETIDPNLRWWAAPDTPTSSDAMQTFGTGARFASPMMPSLLRPAQFPNAGNAPHMTQRPLRPTQFPPYSTQFAANEANRAEQRRNQDSQRLSFSSFAGPSTSDLTFASQSPSNLPPPSQAANLKETSVHIENEVEQPPTTTSDDQELSPAEFQSAVSQAIASAMKVVVQGKKPTDPYYVHVNVAGVLTVIAEELKEIRKEQKTTNERLVALEGKVGQAATDQAPDVDEWPEDQLPISSPEQLKEFEAKMKGCKEARNLMIRRLLLLGSGDHNVVAKLMLRHLLSSDLRSQFTPKKDMKSGKKVFNGTPTFNLFFDAMQQKFKGKTPTLTLNGLLSTIGPIFSGSPYEDGGKKISALLKKFKSDFGDAHYRKLFEEAKKTVGVDGEVNDEKINAMVKKQTDKLNKALQLVQEEEEKEAQHPKEKTTPNRKEKAGKGAANAPTLDLSSTDSSSGDESDGGARVARTTRQDDSDVSDK